MLSYASKITAMTDLSNSEEENLDPEVAECLKLSFKDLAEKKRDQDKECPYVDSSGHIFIQGEENVSTLVQMETDDTDNFEFDWFSEYLDFEPQVIDNIQEKQNTVPSSVCVSKSGLLVVSCDTSEPFDWTNHIVDPQVRKCHEEHKRIVEERVSAHCAFCKCTEICHKPECAFDSDLKYYDSTDCLPERSPYKTLSRDGSGDGSDESSFGQDNETDEIEWKNPKDTEKRKKRPDLSSIKSGRICMYNRIVRETNARLRSLESRARDLEKMLDTDIALYLGKKEAFFRQIGIDGGFDATVFDNPPIYSLEAGNFVKFGVWVVHDSEQLLQWCQDDVLQNFFSRAANLKNFEKLALSDLDRLRIKQHDGKASRYYPSWPVLGFDKTAPEVGDSPCPNRPWYFSRTCALRPHLNNATGRRDIDGECQFCALDRQLHELEFEMKRLFKYSRRWPNSRNLPTGGVEAFEKKDWLLNEKLRRERGPWTRSHGSHSDDSTHGSDSSLWKEVALEDRSKYKRGPDRIHCRDPYWQFNRLKEGFIRVVALESKAQILENRLDDDIMSYLIAKKRFFETNGGSDRTTNFSDEGTPVIAIKFRYFGKYQTLLLAMQEKESKLLLLDLYQRLDNLSNFQKQAGQDLDRLWNKTHDGKSSRYHRNGTERPCSGTALDPNKPWYFAIGSNSKTWADLRRLSSAGCLMCLLDHSLRQLEEQTIRLEKYCRRWPNSKIKPKGAVVRDCNHLEIATRSSGEHEISDGFTFKKPRGAESPPASPSW